MERERETSVYLHRTQFLATAKHTHTHTPLALFTLALLLDNFLHALLQLCVCATKQILGLLNVIETVISMCQKHRCKKKRRSQNCMKHEENEF